MISARRFDRHPAQERVIQIGRFEPGDIGRDAEDLLEDRQGAAHHHRRHDAVADGERALDSDHRPVGRNRIKEIDRADQSESEREEPDGETNEKAGPNEPAAAAHLLGEQDGGETADQADNQNRRVDLADENAAPKTNEDSAVEAMVTTEQDAEDEW